LPLLVFFNCIVKPFFCLILFVGSSPLVSFGPVYLFYWCTVSINKSLCSMGFHCCIQQKKTASSISLFRIFMGNKPQEYLRLSAYIPQFTPQRILLSSHYSAVSSSEINVTVTRAPTTLLNKNLSSL
jgi:hypothetical protein